MRRLMPFLLLSACGSGGGDPSPVPQEQRMAIGCALAGSQAFEDKCSLAREDRADGILLTLSGPEGGFRRLIVSPDGREVRAADGALQPSTTRRGDRMEIALGDDRYLLPAVP